MLYMGVWSNYVFFYIYKLKFLIFLNCFEFLILKINFLIFLNIFSNKNYFKNYKIVKIIGKDSNESN